jgi:3'-phosphoadenosine 5'-phosphosulfate sulfotransferase (PAPS reductase)/FAD synthetase
MRLARQNDRNFIMNARAPHTDSLTTLSDQHLDSLEAETIYLLREVVANFERPALLFSGGKDSLVMLKCAEKAFGIGRLPFPLLMIDTGHNFPEVTTFRDQRAAELGAQLVVRHVESSIAKGTSQAEKRDKEPAKNSTLLPTEGDGKPPEALDDFPLQTPETLGLKDRAKALFFFAR